MMARFIKATQGFNPVGILKIVTTETVENYTVYVIELSLGTYRWTVKHRYSEFHELHEKLIGRFKIDKGLLPPKKLFGNQSDSFVRKRQGELEHYLQTLLYQLKFIPEELSNFLCFDKYEIHGITRCLAEELFHRGDLILQSSEAFHVSPLQLHSITERLKLPEPTCDSGDAKKDIGHVLDFITRIKHVKITSRLDQIGMSNILMNDLHYDLSIFRAVTTLEIAFCSPEKITGADNIKKSVKRLKVFQSARSLKDILLLDMVFGHWHGTPDEAVLVPAWASLIQAEFSYNHLKAIDESVKLMPCVQCLDLSHNDLEDVTHLQNLSSLTHLDLSYNKIQTLAALHTKLGNVTTLKLTHNKLESLQGFSKLYSLENLDVRNNEISQVLEVQSLNSLPCLEYVGLTGNPVTIVLDYRTKVLELFKDRAKEISLDGTKASQKELDTVAILLALQKSKEAKGRGKKHHKKAREATIVDLTPDSSRSHSPAVGACSRENTSTPSSLYEIAPESANAQSGNQIPTNERPVSEGPDLVRVRPKDEPRSPPKLGYQFSQKWMSPKDQSAKSSYLGTMLPETLPSRNDSMFLSHLQELLPNTGALSRRSRTRQERREQQEERIVHVMWCTTVCYTQPLREIMASICITTENLHILEVKSLRGMQGQPALEHIYCIPLVNLQQIVLGHHRLYLRIEEAFVGPQGTYALLTGSMTKTDLFLDSLKLAYRRAISDIDQYEDPHITANMDIEKNLLQALNRFENAVKEEDIEVVLYMLVNSVDYALSRRPSVTHSLVVTPRYLYLIREDYVLWPQATFAIGVSTRPQFDISCVFPIMGKITGIQMYDSDTYSPDHDTSLSQTFSATKTCAMVVPNFIGFGVKLIFDMGSSGEQELDIRVPTSGMRDKFLATLTQVRKEQSEKGPSPKTNRVKTRLTEPDTDSLSTSSGGSNHGAKPKHLRHGAGSKHKRNQQSQQTRSKGVRPDLLPDLSESTVSNQSSRANVQSMTGSKSKEYLASKERCKFDSSQSSDDIVDPKNLPSRESPTGESESSDESCSADLSSRDGNHHKSEQETEQAEHRDPDVSTDDSVTAADSMASREACAIITQIDSSNETDDNLESGATYSTPVDLTPVTSTKNSPDLSDSVQYALSDNAYTQVTSSKNRPDLSETGHSRLPDDGYSQVTGTESGAGLSDNGYSLVTSSENATDLSKTVQYKLPENGCSQAVTPQIQKTQFSLDVQYPSVQLLSHLTQCNEQIQLLAPLSEPMKNLCSMESDEMLNFFHGCVAQIGQSTEELHHILWAPVIPYTKPQKEIVSCIMLSTKAVYFVSDVDPVSQLLKPKQWKSHVRNKSDSYHVLVKGSRAGSTDIHLSSGVIHKHKHTGEVLKVTKPFAVLLLKDLKHVTIGLFDQSFRLVGSSPEQTFACVSRDNKLTASFINELLGVLSCLLPSPSPDFPSGDLDGDQDFYEMFNTYNRCESHEYRHSSKVTFLYPNEDLVNEFMFVLQESIKDKAHDNDLHMVFYLLVHFVDSQTTSQTVASNNPATPSLNSTASNNLATPSKKFTIVTPRALIITEQFLVLGKEDLIYYPIPDFAFGPPATPRLQVLDVRHLENLKNVVLDKEDPHKLSLVFLDEPEVIVNTNFDYYSNYGGRVPRHIRPVPEVQITLLIQNLKHKDKLLSLITKRWSELNDKLPDALVLS